MDSSQPILCDYCHEQLLGGPHSIYFCHCGIFFCDQKRFRSVQVDHDHLRNIKFSPQVTLIASVNCQKIIDIIQEEQHSEHLAKLPLRCKILQNREE